MKLTFGVEWDYVSTVANIYHHNFRAQEGYRRNDKDIMIMYAGNGAILGHIGADFGRHYNLSVYAGYEGITDGFAVFPVSLRNTLLFGKDVRLPRWLCYIDAGYGFTDMADSVCITGRAGCGYRLPLSERVKLDFLLSYRLSYAEIPFSDEGGTVSADRIMRNNNILNAISLGIGITL